MASNHSGAECTRGRPQTNRGRSPDRNRSRSRTPSPSGSQQRSRRGPTPPRRRNAVHFAEEIETYDPVETTSDVEDDWINMMADLEGDSDNDGAVQDEKKFSTPPPTGVSASVPLPQNVSVEPPTTPPSHAASTSSTVPTTTTPIQPVQPSTMDPQPGTPAARGVVNMHIDFVTDPALRPPNIPWDNLSREQQLDENDFRTKLNF